MRRTNTLLLLLIVAANFLSACAQQVMPEPAAGPGPAAGPDGSVIDRTGHSSPSAARKFYDLACELAQNGQPGEAGIRQAIAFCKAALELDNSARYVLPMLIQLSCRDATADHSKVIYGLLGDYVDASADVAVCTMAVDYLVANLASADEQQRLLEDLLNDLGNENVILGSELATRLGTLMAAKSNVDAAGFYFAQAYKNNKFNNTAFAKLAELYPDRLGPELYLERLRLVLREDPTNLDAAIDLAQYAERLELYDIAAEMYEYSAGLFGYLFPAQSLPASIYLPWAVSSYNTKASQDKCLQVAEFVRGSGRFDLLLEAMAGKAAAKMGNGQLATQILRAAEQKVDKLLNAGPGDPSAPDLTPRHAAWFYNFVFPNPQKALSWANIAFAAEPNSASAASLFAYALVADGKSEWAGRFIDDYPPTQISDLVRARILIEKQQGQDAIAKLKGVIARDPGSVAAEAAKDLLKEQGGRYIPPVDPDIVGDALQGLFKFGFAPTLVLPERILSVQLNLRGTEFPYGSDFDAVISIKNNSSDPLVLSDRGLFRGNIRIDARITGDIDRDIPDVVSMKAPTQYLVLPDKTLLIPVRLISGELRRLLLIHPQASLDIEFILYLDPVVGSDGAVSNRLANLPVVKATATRPGLELSGKYLRSRFNLISTGQSQQKVKTAQLFVGLLAEQYEMSDRTPPYKFMYADWMPTMFRNALIHESGLLLNPSEGEWVVKVHTMAQMTLLSMDHALVNAAAENLSNNDWPVRMMACYLLAGAKTADFTRVLEWAAEYDPNPLVREMAAALASGK